MTTVSALPTRPKGALRIVKAVDFFCGAGGLTRGLLDAGIEVLAGVDVDERLRRTYEENNEPSRFVCQDIRDVDVHALRADLGIEGDDVVLYAACTPCQPFSTLNQRKGADDRKNLLLAFAELVRAAPCDFALIENVPGLNTAYGRDVYERFVAVLDEVGLTHREAQFLDAADYGVPQVRKRFVMLASRHGPISLPRPNPGPRPTVRSVIEGYPRLAHGQEISNPPNHVARTLHPRHMQIVQAIPKDGGSRKEIADTSILLKCHQERPTVHKDVFGRMAWDQPAPTLTARCTDVYCGRFVHPEQDRGISLREAAALQSFSDEYRFHGESLFFLAAQVGNAVPVKLGRRLGGQVVAAASMHGLS